MLAGEAEDEDEEGEDAAPGRIRFAGFYGLGRAMGMSLADLRGSSLWQFRAQVLGWAKSKGIKTAGDAPTPDEFDAFVRSADF